MLNTLTMCDWELRKTLSVTAVLQVASSGARRPTPLAHAAPPAG